MPVKQDDATSGEKLLRLFYRLISDKRRHYQSDLAIWLNCSRQTIIRLAGEIENVIGCNLVSGIDKHRRWYQVNAKISAPVSVAYQDLQCLQNCIQLAADVLPSQMFQEAERIIANLASAFSLGAPN